MECIKESYGRNQAADSGADGVDWADCRRLCAKSVAAADLSRLQTKQL